MPFLPIVSRPEIRDAGTAATPAGPLPIFYMNDYSVMGLRVSDCDAALELLAARRYTVSRRQGGHGVVVGSAEDIRAIAALLAENGLGGEMADLVTQIYQG
ncbi:MAG: hypothetical protein QNJ04_09170 [Desulfobacterales bacterium]|nr:hypothetical protein [Desulfobacterales bacterium]